MKLALTSVRRLRFLPLPFLFSSVLVWTACSSSNNKEPTGPSAGGEGNGAGASGSGGSSSEKPPGVGELGSAHIVVDQFGYLADSEKIAVVRNPQQGFDAPKDFVPGTSYQLRSAATDEVVFEAPLVPWRDGAVHDQSGDVTWWFDFSSVTESGEYYVHDPSAKESSAVFRIGADVYREVLKQAQRTFFYQRAGFEKEAKYAGEAWADGKSHAGPGQDGEARLYSDRDNAATERDLSGGWYDAGDYNKYTAWTGDYVAIMLRAYEENPAAFTDDLNIPESGNGVPDILDEARFGLDHLVRLQNEDGGVLSIVSLDHASPPSAATGPSVYGPASSNATIRAALAYAAGARVFASLDATYAADLRARALRAWEWLEENPAVEFRNNEGAATGVGAGQQEVPAETRAIYHTCLAVEMYRLTGESKYKTYFETNYRHPKGESGSHYSLFGGYVAAWEMHFHDYYLDYTQLADADETIKQEFLTAFKSAMERSADNFGILEFEPDPYLAAISTGNYTWGVNSHKSRTGTLFYSYIQYNLDEARQADARRAAERYIHGLHGVNPLGLVYLSNMGEFGAESSVTKFYHTWFAPGTAWDEVGVSKNGPVPGFLVGGPNPRYNWDDCCETLSCGGPENNAKCGEAPPSPPFGQPAQKSYKNFNDSWPLNSWSVSENSNGYQLSYIRLLSKFVGRD